MNWTARSLAGGVAALALAVLAALPRSASAETPLERGTYLMRGIVACGNCHTPKGPDGHPIAGQELAGGLVINAPVFRAVVPNITPDPETGVGKWTDAQLITAIREGKRPDGSIIGPPMPIGFYRNLSDGDVRALVAYIRAAKPIHNVVEKSSYKIPLPPAYGPPVAHVAEPPRTNKLVYGKYLANIAHCMECHTPRLQNGQLDMSRVGAGGQQIEAFPSGVVTTANLTPANPTGVAHWTDAQVEKAITSGVRPDGRKLVILMAFDWYKNVHKSDLDDIVAYLRTLPAAKP